MFALRYINAVEEKLVIVLSQYDSIKKAAEMITRVVLDARKVLVVDKYGIIDTELTERASGLALFRSLKSSRKLLSEGDILIISAYHPEDEYDLDHLKHARSLGASVITISPEGELARSADLALINNDDGSNGVFNNLSGIIKPFCPVSGLVNAALAWAIVSETAAFLIDEGKIPTVFWGEHLVGGKNKTAQARKLFTSLGY